MISLPQLCQIIGEILLSVSSHSYRMSIVEKVELTMEGTVHSFRVYLNTICQMFGLAFSRSKVCTTHSQLATLCEPLWCFIADQDFL